jgi:O-antigen ligase
MRAGGFGWYENANDLSVILVTVIPLSILLANTVKHAIFRCMYLGVSALFAFNILFTGSRNGLLGLLVVGILCIIFSDKYSRLVRAIVAMLLLLSIFTVGLKAVIERSDLGSNLTGDDSSENRIEQWRAGARMFATHPIFGVGPGGFMDDVSDYGGISGLAPHNTFIQVFAESGLVGGVLFLLFSFKPIYDLRSITRNSASMPKEVIYYKFIVVSIIGFWICAFFTNRYQFYILYVLVALSVAVRENIIRKKGAISVKGIKTNEPYVKGYNKLNLVDNSTIIS